MHLIRSAVLLSLMAALVPATPAAAASRSVCYLPYVDCLCDPSFEDCRDPLLTLIKNETQGIDVAFWFMEDLRYTVALAERWKAGVPVRVIIDTEANVGYPGNIAALQALKDAGIPMLERTTTGIVHWKMMLFHGQDVVEFSGANYSPHGFVAQNPYIDYLDEVIYFTHDPAIVNSFRTRYDDAWTASGYTPFANLSGTRTRRYPVYPILSELVIPTWDGSFATRSVSRYNAETKAIDTIMFRIIDRRHTDALIAAVARGVPFRLITDEDEYRDATRLWNAYNIDRLYMGGAQIKLEAHLGALHQKSTLLHGQQMTIFGSSNWTRASATSQLEHNIFTKRPYFYQYFTDQFERKWNNLTGNIETKPFVPLPPTPPVYQLPANAASNQPLTVRLSWHAGPWAHKYDIYFGTTPDPPLLVSDIELGPSETPTDYVTYDVSGLQASTTYYWRIVGRTMANLTKGGPVWNFRTIGSAPTAGDGDVVLYAAKAPVREGKWTVAADSTAAGGARMTTADAGVRGSVTVPAVDYFDMTFIADAGVPYHLWIRGKANGNSWASDSAFVQFNDSVTSSGAPVYRIGTTGAASVTIEDCSGCGVSAWGWQDDGFGGLGQNIYFAESGTHTVRVLMREDGLSIDQIVLSRSAFLTTAPGSTKNDGTILREASGDGAPPPPTPSPTLPSGWESQDIGVVGNAGTASESGGTFTVSGGGGDVWGTSDAFHYAYRSLTGDGTIVARVASISGTQAWTKMGVMIRGSTATNAAYAFMIVSSGKGLAFQRRTADGVSATHTAGGTGSAPRWVRLERTGNVITASVSGDGSTWTVVGSDTFSMPDTVLVGLAAHSHDMGSLATATFDGVSVVAGPSLTASLPSGWTSQDVGAVAVAGTAFESDGRFTVEGSGDDIWGAADAFHFAYRPLSRDGEIVARVAGIFGSEAWTKVGVMIRASLDRASAYAFMLASAGKGLAFQRRTADGAFATHTGADPGTASGWVRLTRRENVITAAVSNDGAAWTVVGSETFAMPSDVLVGLAVSSHDTNRLASGNFDRVSITES